jgi:hypothetical protein
MSTKKENVAKATTPKASKADKQAKLAKVETPQAETPTDGEAEPTNEVEQTVAPVAEVKEPKAKKEKEVKEPKIKVLSDKQTIKLSVATPVYSRKDARDKASLMRADSEVIVQQLIDAGPTGTSLVSVKKPNSKRIFYTPMENLTAQGVEFKAVEPKAETPAAETAPAEETQVEATMGEQEVAAVLDQEVPEMGTGVEAQAEEMVEA